MGSQITNKNIYDIIGSESESDNVNDNPVKISNIVAFEGNLVIPLVKLEDKDYQNLGVTKNRDSSNKKPIVKGINNVTKFFVSTNYKDSKKANHVNGFPNKDNISKTLSCTRVCNNVKRASPEDEYSICYRENCSFAHSLDEFKDTMCGFDKVCRFRKGTLLPDGTYDKNIVCMFRHSDESSDFWMNRTRRTLPDLPQTSEKTRKQIINNEKMVEQVISTPSHLVDLNIPPTPIKVDILSKYFNDLNIVKRLDYAEDTIPVVDKYNSRSSDRRHRSNRSRSPHQKYRKSQYVIRVPTKELAETVIKTSFNKGVYDVRVIIE